MENQTEVMLHRERRQGLRRKTERSLGFNEETCDFCWGRWAWMAGVCGLTFELSDPPTEEEKWD